jgi:tetratricopeptide (TPR) repeat protein
MANSNSTDLETPSDRLSGDEARRAGPAVRGYLYQFWRTVEAWLEIGPDDLLFVEGAEDFDVVARNGATAVQVKDNKASGSLTLTTSAAQSAIRNYWLLRQNNPGRTIHFKYVTTAVAGAETLGFNGDKGIDVWSLCRQAPVETCRADVERVRSFLQEKPLGNELLRFLNTASPDQIKQDLIEPLEWICDQPALEGIEEIVTGRLLELGKVQGLTAKDATDLADQLCMEVARGAAEDAPKRLDFAGLRKRLDAAVNVELPRETLRRLEQENALVESLFAYTLNPGQTLPAITSALDAFTPPVSASNLWPRKALVDRVRGGFASGVVFLSGGTGIGKTSLVLHALDRHDRVLWAALRDRATSEILQACRALRARVAEGTNPCIVLDDLNPDNDPRNIEHEIGLTVAAVRRQGGALIITSYSKAAPRLATVLGLAEDNNLSVPVFDENEVRDYLRDTGCPQNLLEALSRVVWVHTSGHPQLVAARISTLKSAGFPKPTADDFLEQPKDVEDAQAEARAIVRAMPDDARNLLYRLSISLPPLRRSHILAIASGDQPIALAGEIFDAMVGPWFQQVAQGHYCISPLLSKCANQVLASEEVKKLNAGIAVALLAERTLTPFEFSGVLMHGLAGEAEGVLAIATRGFMTAPRRVKRMLVDDLAWVTAVGLEPGTQLPIANRTVRQLFRLVQWEIAGLKVPNRLKTIAQAMEQEFAADTTELVVILPRILYLSKLVIAKDFSVPVADVVSHVLEIKRLTDIAHSQDASIDVAGEVPPLYKKAPRLHLAEMFTVSIMPRVRTVDDLVALITALDALDREQRNWLLAGLSVEDGELRILFNSIWLSITKADKQEYEAYEQVLARAIAAGRRWGSHAWMRAAARTRSAVLDETLDRREDAENAAKEIGEEIGMSLNLEDQLAVIAFNHKDYADALSIWERVLPEWNSDERFHDMQPVFGLRCAAICASKLGRWRDAGSFYEQGISRGSKFDKLGWKTGFRTDRAYALWMDGDYPAALRLFLDVAAELQALPNKPESFDEYAVQKLAGHTLSVLVTPGGTLADYVPGMCSDLSPHKDISTLPPVPPVYTSYFVQELATRTGNRAIASLCADKIRNAPFAFLRAMAALDDCKRMIASDDLDSVVNFAVTFAIEMEKSSRRKELPLHAPDPESLTAELTEPAMNVFARPGLWAAVLRAKAIDRSVSELVEQWRSRIDPQRVILADELNRMAQYAGASAAELGQILKAQEEPAERRIWAGAFLVGNEDASLLDTAYAHTLLVNSAKDYTILWDVGGPSVDELIRRDWRRFRNASFLLRNPRLHVDSIQSACEAGAKGWPTAARIVLAWNPATELRLPNEMLESLRRIAANESRAD